MTDSLLEVNARLKQQVAELQAQNDRMALALLMKKHDASGPTAVRGPRCSCGSTNTITRVEDRLHRCGECEREWR